MTPNLPLHHTGEPTGRALDAAVAEKVMGWKWVSVNPSICRTPGTRFLVSPDTPTTDKSFYRPATMEEKVDEYATDSVRPYSTDISAAWEAVEHLQLTGNMVSVNASSRGSGSEWWCVVYLDALARGFVESEYYPTAPLAICNAALVAAERLATPVAQTEGAETRLEG